MSSPSIALDGGDSSFITSPIYFGILAVVFVFDGPTDDLRSRFLRSLLGSDTLLIDETQVSSSSTHWGGTVLKSPFTSISSVDMVVLYYVYGCISKRICGGADQQ